jgi:hypothetical protein
MTSFDSLVNVYLLTVFALAAVALGLSFGVVATGVVRNRRVRLSRHQSLPAYDCSRLALHH